jgi:hypothetical protein
VKDPDTGKRLPRVNPEALWIVKAVPALRIIDDSTWEAVQTIKARYGSQAGNKRQTRKRLLSGLVRCGGCGGAMTIVNRERYSCSARRERGTCKNPAGISAARLEARVLDGLRDILLGRDGMIEEFAMAFRAEIDRLRRSRHQSAAARRKELEKVDRGIERCVAFITEGDGDPSAVRTKLAELEAHKRTLERALCNADPTPELEIHPNVAELYRRKVIDLQSVLTDETGRPQAMEIVRSMIDRIEVSAGETRGDPQVLLVGALASILGFATAGRNDKAAAVGGGVGRVLMVAGAGFEPATFRL